jgi:hypothetical protein
MSEAVESAARWSVRWLAAATVATGLGMGVFTGTGTALAEDGSASTAGRHDPSSTSDTSSGGEDTPEAESSTLPPGIRIADRTLQNLGQRDRMQYLRVQSAMDRLSRSMTTLSNVLEKASDTAQNVVGNTK